jgi:hypothetical protein
MNKEIKQPFLEDSEFFKSNEMNEHGKVIEKSIPTVQVKTKKKEVKISTERKPTKEVEKFVKDVEAKFKEIDKIVMDACKKGSENKSSYIIDKVLECKSHYSKFKNCLSYVINDIINYPEQVKQQAIEPESQSPRSEYSKTRISI